MPDWDVIVVGGGLVGLAVGYGLARQGRRVALLDEGDGKAPASFGNFGLVWVQSKGDGASPYAAWTLRSAELWPAFARELAEVTGVDVDLRQPGGLHICLGEAEWNQRRAFVDRMHNHIATAARPRMLDREETAALVPGLGETVAGASFGPKDGHVNPLALSRALLAAARRAGVTYLPNHPVAAVRPLSEGYAVVLPDDRTIKAPRMVLAAGLANRKLADSLGRHVPLEPERGQILVTQRCRRLLDVPTTYIRQTGERSVLLGDSRENVGFDYGTKVDVGRDIAARAVATLPALRDVKVVRTWGALRVMTPDGLPIYQQWRDLPGLFVLACHSGVTLAAAHAKLLAPAIDAGVLPEEIRPFDLERFDAAHARAV